MASSQLRQGADDGASSVPSDSGGGCVTLEYKVVELSNVSEEEIEVALNEWTRKGWNFDTLQFAMRDSSKRPAMAFLLFTREAEE